VKLFVPAAILILIFRSATHGKCFVPEAFFYIDFDIDFDFDFDFDLQKRVPR
jgi:hypothetical protein